MKKLTITLKTVTPMFLAGVDGKTPELRPPSIKGMMRFWWRAINGHLSIKKLLEAESRLFGASDEKIGRSKFSLYVQTESADIFTEANPLPHHTGDNNCEYLSKTPSCNKNGRCSKGFSLKAIAADKTFKCIIRVNENDIQKIQDIFKATLILGGFGKRSRRGFGSVEIVKINGNNYEFNYALDTICEILNSIAPAKFGVQSDRIIKTDNRENAYPYIEEIQIGQGCKDYKDLLKVIGQASHKNDCEQTGFARGQKRFASPVYVSVIRDRDIYKPIVTKLHSAPESPLSTTDKSNAFISDILGGCK